MKNATAVLESYRYRAFSWRNSLNLAGKIILALMGACIIGLAAQLRFYLPFTPVPITGQTMAVLLMAVLLGKNWGGISTAIYAALGAAGLPWFAGMQSGLGYLSGATGGYIFGFILAAFVIGYLSDNFVIFRSWYGMLSLMLLANFVLIYGVGLFHLGLVTGIRDISQLLLLGAVPFLVGDLIKAFAAAALAFAFSPKQGRF